MMHSEGLHLDGAESAARVWQFAEYEFDELRRELKVRGTRVELESKPLDVLLQLLLHAGEVVTKEELLASVWPAVMVVDGSLATAVSKLRKAMGDEQHPVIVTVPRIGYRLVAPVRCKAAASFSGPELGFVPDEPVPGRPQWRLSRLLDRSGSSEVWVAENPRTREQRVFKFAANGILLKGLKREITVFRFLLQALGERAEFVKILEWNFENAPYFLESEYAGPNLKEWSEQQGGLASVPIQRRLQILVDICKAVAAAHSVGVLHKDLKPANVLVVPEGTNDEQIKIADFGSASLFDPDRLQRLGITNAGFTENQLQEKPEVAGTLMYMAPEVLAGGSPSTSSDVYALGVLLYQMVIGDFRKPLAPGWEEHVIDPVLRQDIADAACGDAGKRLNNAAELAERLTSLPERRVQQDQLEAERIRAMVAERQLAATKARTPWIVITGAVLCAGMAVSFALYRRAAHERDHANRQTAIATSINRFLSDDLLGRSNPFSSGKATESLTDAIKQAAPAIDQQFKAEPLIAARLHQTIARALDNRSAYPEAKQEYEHAAALFRQADGELSQDAIIARLQRVSAEARSYQKDSLPTAKSLLAEQEALIARLPQIRPDLPVWLDTARGMIALISNDAKAAAEHFKVASENADLLPMFDESAQLTLKQRLAFAYIRLGNGPEAERLLRELIVAFTRIAGPENPNVLRVRLNLAQAYMIQNKHMAAVREANAIYPSLMAALGPEHELTMQLLTTRAQSEGSLGMWDDAIRDDMAIHERAVKKQGPLSFFAIATLSDASLAMCRSGRTAEGVVNARKAYEQSSKAFGDRAGLTGGTASTLASCLIPLGQLNEADKLLMNIDIPTVTQLAGDPDWGAGVKLLQAKIAWHRGDLDTARNRVREITPVFTRPNAEIYQQHELKSLTTKLEIESQ
ncbi:MAG: winged helix-turn-helix domain-containing protein [Acidobacteria bacterium]|nr:winged helix-turn-helix domain-containing protein [Acidobacteriota bacterium]